MGTFEFDGDKYKKASRHQKEWGNSLIGELSLKGKEEILDLGCGDGSLTEYLSQFVPGLSLIHIFIDILVEISKEDKLSDNKEVIVKSGYICMSEASDRISFNKGYTDKGFAERVFHLHLRYIGDNDELYFRDYLIEHTNIAVEYERMKLKLWKKYEFNRDGYTNSKTDFIKKYTEKAKLEYGDRY